MTREANSKFADDTKLAEVAGTPQGCAATQTAWKNEQTGTSTRRTAKSCAWGRTAPFTSK